ncbi:MAG TPA: hypothetical protein VE955_06010, partial [Candidatus Dormibacteraeota bacterium]|nr:hypothetical protein [Candidatus Dormibacteraeota bacterium]
DVDCVSLPDPSDRFLQISSKTVQPASAPYGVMCQLATPTRPQTLASYKTRNRPAAQSGCRKRRLGETCFTVIYSISRRS